MKKLFLLSLVLMFIATVSFASNPCIVDSTLVADGVNVFNTIQSAINSWCAGGTNAAQTPPFVINVVPVAPYAEHIDLNDINIGTGDIVGDITIQSSVPGTYVLIQLQSSAAPADTNGVAIYQSTENVTFRDILFYPDIVTNVITGYLTRMDENAASAANTLAFYHCLWTNVSPGGAPLVTTRQQIYTAGYPAAFPSTVRQVHFWPDLGEVVNLILDDCSFYGSFSYTVYARPIDGDTVTINNCCFGTSDYYQLYGRSDATAVTGGVINITGTDQKAGPDNCTIFIQQWNGDNHHIYVAYGYNVCQLNISQCILDVYGPDLGTSAGADTRSISCSGTWLMNIADTIINNEGAGSMVVDGAPNPETFDRVTFNAASGFFLTAGLATGSITCRDCIFSSTPTVWGGTVPTLGIDVDYCAYVESGPDAIGARGTIQTDGANITTGNPLYLGYDFKVASFFDVDNGSPTPGGYQGGGTAASNLAGGADYVGGSPVGEWTIY